MATQPVTLREILEQQVAQYLEDVGQHWEISFRGTPPRKLLIEQIAAAMLDKHRLFPFVTAAPAEARQALELLVERGEVARGEFEALYGHFGSSRTLSYNLPGYMTVAQALHNVGLVLPRADRKKRGQDVIVMPSDLADVLRICLSNDPEALPPLKTVSRPPEVVDYGMGLVTYVSYALGYILQRGLKMTQADEIHRTHVAKLAQHVYGQARKEPDRSPLPGIDFLYQLLVASGLIVSTSDDAYDLTEQGRRYVDMDRVEQAQVLFTAWKRTSGSADVIDMSGVATFWDGRWSITQSDAVRLTVLDALRRLKVGEWIQIDDDTLTTLTVGTPATGIAQMSPRYISFEHHSGPVAIQRFNMAIARIVLSDLLPFFGVVAVSRRRLSNSTSQTCSLTPLGAWLIEKSDASPPVAASVGVMIQPSHDVLLTPEASSATILAVERACDLVLRDVASTYRITKDSIGRAMMRGESAERIREDLERASGQPLPANVLRSIQDWSAAYGRIRVLRRTILVSDTPALLKELQATKKLKGLIGGSLSDTVAEIPDQQETLLLKRLREIGHLPVADPGLDKSSKGTSGGRVTSTSRTQFTVAELRRLYGLLYALYEEQSGEPAYLERLLDKIHAMSSPQEQRELDRIALRATDDLLPAFVFDQGQALPEGSSGPLR